MTQTTLSQTEKHVAGIMAYRISRKYQNGYLVGDQIAWLDYRGNTQISTITPGIIECMKAELAELGGVAPAPLWRTLKGERWLTTCTATTTPASAMR